jgi:DNA-binding transcriptional MerR regulator
LSLSELARLLRQPQHRLIYLCEKGIVVPDLGGADGRGSSRLFSAFNVVEFALALRLRDLKLPVNVIGAVLYALRAFATELAGRRRESDLLNIFRNADSPELRVLVKDGERLYFSLHTPGKPVKLFGGIPLKVLLAPLRRRLVKSDLAQVNAPEAAPPTGFGLPEGSQHLRLEINVTQIARDLKLDR